MLRFDSGERFVAALARGTRCVWARGLDAASATANGEGEKRHVSGRDRASRELGGGLRGADEEASGLMF